MTAHAEYSLRGPGIPKILNLPLTVATSKAGSTKCLVASEDGKILDLVATGTAAVGAVVANEGAISEKQQVRIRIKKRAAGIASKTV
jgi:hypothetical protein